MELEQAIQIIDTLIKNKEYNKIIHDYINNIIVEDFVYSEEDGELIISKIGFDEYFSIIISGPEIIEIDFVYHDKNNQYKHTIIFTKFENEIKLTSNIDEYSNNYYKYEQYKNDSLKYAFYKDIINNIETTKEIIFNKEKLNYTSIIKKEEDKKPFCLYTVNKVKKPFTFNTNEKENEYEVSIICEISEKQYNKVKKGIINDEIKENKHENKLLKLLKKA